MNDSENDSISTNSHNDSGGEEEMTRINVSDEDVENWLSELDGIEKKMAGLIARKDLLQRALGSIKDIERLKGNTSDDDSHEATRLDSSEGDLKLIDAIPMVLQKFGRPMAPRQIKKHLKDVGFTQPYGENYFYTALKRGAEKGKLTRTADKKYIFVSGGPVNGLGLE